MGNTIARPPYAWVFVLESIVVRVEEAASTMQAYAELVAMIVTVALAHNLENRDSLAACPVVGALIGAQHG